MIGVTYFAEQNGQTERVTARARAGHRLSAGAIEIRAPAPAIPSSNQHPQRTRQRARSGRAQFAGALLSRRARPYAGTRLRWHRAGRFVCDLPVQSRQPRHHRRRDARQRLHQTAHDLLEMAPAAGRAALGRRPTNSGCAITTAGPAYHRAGTGHPEPGGPRHPRSCPCGTNTACRSCAFPARRTRRRYGRPASCGSVPCSGCRRAEPHESGATRPVSSSAAASIRQEPAAWATIPLPRSPTPYGRVHNHDNLFVMDGSLHVTNGGFNPALTIMALAFRCSDHLARTL